MAASEPIDPRIRLAISQWPHDAPRGAVSTFCTEHAISRKSFYELRKRAKADGPAAVLVWSSWAPRSGEVLEDFDLLHRACDAKGLSLIMVDVQEPLVEARSALEGRDVPWVHDRHGALLKRHRVFRVPMLLILDPEGRPLATLEPKPVAVESWSRPP